MKESSEKRQSVAAAPKATNQRGLKKWERLRLAIPEPIAGFLIPSARPFTLEQRKRETERNKEKCAEIEARIASWDNWEEPARNQVLDQAEKLIASERSRRNSVQTRLNAALGMASVAISVTLVVAGYLLGQVEPAANAVFLLGISLAALYIAFQLVLAVRAAIIGLERSSIRALTSVQILPTESEDATSVKRRIVTTLLQQFGDLQEITNRSVTQMAIAHTALKNACIGVLIAILVLGVGVVWRSARQEDSAIEQRVIHRIRSDPGLADFLRGPRGLRGERGERGPQGDPGYLPTPTSDGNPAPQ